MRPSSRRNFLKSSAALSGALVIAFFLPQGRGRFAHAQAPAASKPVHPNAFLRIGKDGSCTVLLKHLEMGQGVMTALPMLVAEELECDWSKVRAELAPAGAEYAHTVFGMQMTGASSSVTNSYDQLRTVGAQARTMLMQAAADQWKVKVSEVRADKGFVLGPGGRKLSYGQLAEAAARLPVPQDVALKDAKDFKVIGKPTRRIDSADKVTGKAQFGIDVQRKNLHTALVLHRPTFGSVIKDVNAEKVKAIPGVTHVVEIPRAVAVVARNFWAAKTGRDALQVEWQAANPSVATLDSAKVSEQMRAAAKTPGKVAKAGKPDALKAAAKTIVAEYEFPYLAHAAMEPLNCTVDFNGDSAEIWVGSQYQTMDHAAAAKALDIAPGKVKLHTMLAGGGFGRRANPDSDYIVEACRIARQVKVPVKVIWTREDDMKGGYYRSAFVHRVEVGVDAQNGIGAWNHTIAGGSILAGTSMQDMAQGGIDPFSIEGVADTPYAIPNMHLTLHSIDTGVPVLWWRSVGNSHGAFVMESMMDELARHAGKDPVAFRRDLLAQKPRVVKVLDVAAQKAGWGSAPPQGRARGIAVHECFGSVCAQVAEVSLQGDAVRVHRVVAAFDCGLAVNPMTVEAQVQSAIAFGLSAALQGKITFKDGQVQQSNFHDYPVLRMNEMPQVEVHLVSGGDKPGGVGEVAVPPVAPAVANALFALTGKRARALPLSDTKWT